jgi:hypothetical protein
MVGQEFEVRFNINSYYNAESSYVGKKLQCFLPANKPYRLSGRRLSAKLVPTVVGRGMLRGQRNISPQQLILVF